MDGLNLCNIPTLVHLSSISRGAGTGNTLVDDNSSPGLELRVYGGILTKYTLLNFFLQ